MCSVKQLLLHLHSFVLVLMIDSYFSPHGSKRSCAVCLWVSGTRQINLRRMSLMRCLCEAALLLLLSNTRIGLRGVDMCHHKCLSAISRTKTHTTLLSSLQRREHMSIQNDVIWCYFVLAHCVCAHKVYWKGHPLWLLSHWEPTCHTADMTLFECDVYMWSELQWAPQMTKWLGVPKQPTNRPVLF